VDALNTIFAPVYARFNYKSWLPEAIAARRACTSQAAGTWARRAGNMLCVIRRRSLL